MVAPRLLVSPDLVPRAALVGLAPARSTRPSVPSRPWHPLQSDPADGITQREAAWLLPCGFTLRPWRVSTGLRQAPPGGAWTCDIPGIDPLCTLDGPVPARAPRRAPSLDVCRYRAVSRFQRLLSARLFGHGSKINGDAHL